MEIDECYILLAFVGGNPVLTFMATIAVTIHRLELEWNASLRFDQEYVFLGIITEGSIVGLISRFTFMSMETKSSNPLVLFFQEFHNS